MTDMTSISKFLSYVLRHKPEAIGLELDAEGWALVQDVLEKTKDHGYNLTKAIIEEIVDTSDKKRFALSGDGELIRAVQGHSTKTVSIKFKELVPPDVLYHGTAERVLENILHEGLKPSARQYVHLSADKATALNVGKRYGKPVVLKINAKLMHENNFKFYRADNGVWLTNGVPAKFISQA